MAWNTIDNSQTFEDDFNSYTAELKEGQFLGENKNYRLEKNRGAGGMGEVWLATEIRNNMEIRKVVVKTIRPDRRGNEGAQEKALKQFQLIQSLTHQNICPIYVIEKDPACGYLIVMGYANDKSYASWFAGRSNKNEGMPVKQVCNVLRPIANALDFAHQFGVIHRDVKPENMMFTRLNGKLTAWLIDFGIAANLRSATQATQGQYSSSGSTSYMAPEQRSGELQTAQTDEYSLAMVALEFLAGSLSPLSFSRLAPAIQGVLGKALSEKPAERYSTCREFIDALSAGTTLSASSEVPKRTVTPLPVPSTPPFLSEIEAIKAAESATAEAKRRAAEETLRQQIQTLEKSVTDEYQSGHYTEAIGHPNKLLKLKPDHQNAKWLLEQATKKLEIPRKRGLLLFVKVLGFLSIFYGTFLLYEAFHSMMIYHDPNNGFYNQEDDNIVFVFTLIVVSVSSVITAICIRDIYKFPNKSVSRMALVGLGVIFANTLITGTPCYEPLFQLGLAGLMTVGFLVFYIPYTLIVGGIALYLNSQNHLS